MIESKKKKAKKFKFYVTIKQDYAVMSRLFKFCGKSECVNIIILWQQDIQELTMNCLPI